MFSFVAASKTLSVPEICFGLVITTFFVNFKTCLNISFESVATYVSNFNEFTFV